MLTIVKEEGSEGVGEEPFPGGVSPDVVRVDATIVVDDVGHPFQTNLPGEELTGSTGQGGGEPWNDRWDSTGIGRGASEGPGSGEKQ